MPSRRIVKVPRLPNALKILGDTGYFIGLFDPKDHHHVRCKSFFTAYRGVTVTTWAAFTEICEMLAPQRQKAFFSWATQAQSLGYLQIEAPPADAVAALWDLMARYDDLPMDFCDASLVYLATHLSIDRIATVDLRNFSVYRLPNNRRFTHVLDEPR